MNLESNRCTELIKSIETATETLKKLNEELSKAIECRYSDEDKQLFIDCIRNYCLLNGIRARVAVCGDTCRIYYHYLDERPIKCSYSDEIVYTEITWNDVPNLVFSIDSIMRYIRDLVAREM